MRFLIFSILIATSFFSSNASSSDNSAISDCLITGKGTLETFELMRQMTPGVKNEWIDSEVSAIHRAQAECAEKRIAAKVEKERMDKLGEEYARRMQNQPTFSGDSLPSSFQPGGLFNPIHIKVTE